MGIVIAWLMITFTPKIDGCPRGYIGPGGKHMHGMYRNCTGGTVCFSISAVLFTHF